MESALDVEPAIRCVGLRKRYDDVVAVDSVDIEVKRGECMGLLGPNGAGKTTTVEMLEGLTEKDEGDITIFGKRYETHADEIRAMLGVALQETRLPDRLTVFEVARLFRSFYKTGRDVDDVLSSLSLEEKRNAQLAKLSGGQRQRVAIACALVGDPRLLFLDEPTTGLDPQARRAIWTIVEDYKRAGGTVILTTHYMDEATQLCDRVAIIDKGRIIALDTPRALIASLDGNQLIEVSATDVDGLFRTCSTLFVTAQDPSSVRIQTDDAVRDLPRLLELLKKGGIEPSRIGVREATLEDVFLAKTGRTLRENS